MNNNTITGVMGLGRQCERCGGTGTVHNGPWVVCCPECDGDGFYHEPEDLSDQPEPDYPDSEPDFNRLERDEAARLDAIEAERDLKAYYAEHGDDAPEPLPAPSFYGATPIPVAGDWRNKVAAVTAERDAALKLAENIGAEYRQQIELLKASCAEKDAVNESAKSLVEVARAAQDQLRDELAAVTAERDALKTLQEIVLKLAQHRDALLEEKGRWVVLRRQIRDAVMQADASQPLTNELYELLK